ncbi:MAG: dihydroorotate dehydrogenase (quinone) [Bdellovibrionales bacterium RIFOXYC1_FULL_54_43]|nr:MAG: dihydroorotate dehydrogenase (quinone) [Bdellovibrionales bacterium RIFOXYC1_FULL_54_43]OFZ84756.1 MAG: dihydroorotate dehydrogenase (quinone) [Bdellovibrionales bacterium RIFOXYD1_FULL_55_31]
MFWRVVKKVLFRLDPENVHSAFIRLIRIGIRLRGVPLRIASGEAQPPRLVSSASKIVFGMEFRSRVGLAAGFDKDAEVLLGLPDLGFGFAEVGTVTPRAQPGNSRPRLFRDPARAALFNRMGFNNLGAEVVARNIAEARGGLPSTFRVGVNIGKNRDTPLEEASSDYSKAVKPFETLADYVVINVSSPNTPGLRSLQTVEAIRSITGAVIDVILRWKKPVPLLLKLAPEIQGHDLKKLMAAAESAGINGWVLTNTLGGGFETPRETLSGGWSGGPLTNEARRALVEARSQTRLPIVSVGGILTPQEAVARCRCGAELIQIYSGWIFGGPSFPSRLRRALSEAGF